MKYKEAFEELEKKDKEKAYHLDLCRRNNLSICETPIWFAVFIGLFGLYIFPIISIICLGIIIMIIFFMLKVNKDSKNKILYLLNAVHENGGKK